MPSDGDDQKETYLDELKTDPLLSEYRHAVSVFTENCGSEKVAVLAVLEEISANYRKKDEDGSCLMSRLISKYRDEFGEIIKLNGFYFSIIGLQKFRLFIPAQIT